MQVMLLFSAPSKVQQMWQKLESMVLVRHIAWHDRHVCVCVCEFKQQKETDLAKTAWQHRSNEGVCRAADQEDII